MRKKFIAVYALMAVLALGSTTLTSCVDDNESASVTAIRNAKAEQLNALAAASNAEAEVQKAEALLRQAQTAQLEQQTAQEKAEFEAKIEALKAQYEQQRQNYEQLIIKNQASFRNTLYLNYIGANNTLQQLEKEYITAQLNLASALAGVTSAEKAAQVTILAQEEIIAQNKAKIEAYKALEGNSHDELIAKAAEIDVQISDKTANKNLLDQAQKDAETAFEKSKVTYNGDKVTDQGNEIFIEPTLAVGQAILDINEANYQLPILQYENVAPEKHSAAYDVMKASLIDANVASVRDQLTTTLETEKLQLGDPKDKYSDKPGDTNSAYAIYNHLKDLMDEAEKTYKELLEDKDATEGDILNAKNAFEQLRNQYLNSNSVTTDNEGNIIWRGTLALAIYEKDQAQEKLDEFEASVKAFSGDDYKAYEDAITKTLEAGAAWDKAYETYVVAVTELAELNGTKGVINGLLAGTPNIEKEIAQCEANIAEAEQKKVAANSVQISMQWTTYIARATYNYTDSNGHEVKVGDMIDRYGNYTTNEEEARRGEYVYSSVNAEAYYKECELEVENLKSEIAAQKLIVAQCKAELEAAINSGAIDDETPEEGGEETPAE